MDEYIKREDALDAVLFALCGTGYQSRAIGAIRDISTADVVPKSEVLALENEIERLKYILDSYALQYGTVMDQHLVIEKERAEVAREIFEEIEKHRDKIHGIALLLPEELAELKKKYTEGEA